MEIYTVSLFGHRRVEELRLLETRLAPIIRELIMENVYVSFLIGRNGDFDEYAASVIKRVQNELDMKNSDLTLVLPYEVADIRYYEDYYDDVIIPEEMHGVHPKAAIKYRNFWMVERADLVICYVGAKGGAEVALKYAEKLDKRIMNLFVSDASAD